MELIEKLGILGGAAKYDASCATSGSGQGTNLPAGVCHSWTGDGRCVSLLKVLFSNSCRFDCAYCVNRASADAKRATFTVQELVDITCEFYRRNYIEGLFLSSGIFADPDIVMEKLIAVARTLRQEAGFTGYIHLKIIPGAGGKYIREAGLYTDRISCNIELPTEKSLALLAPQKSGKVIMGAMDNVRDATAENEDDRLMLARKGSPKLDSLPVFAPAGQSTQLIVGASEEDDNRIINLASAFYKKYSMRRVYYSAYTPVGLPGGPGIPDKRLPALPEDTLLFARPGEPIRRALAREHRLYQADWLMRFYHFASHEILEDEPYLDTALDPKSAWALRHLDFFPIEVNKADYELLLRAPGIGAKSARRIIEARRSHSLSFDNLRRIGVTLKRAKYFLTAQGSFIDKADDAKRIRRKLADDEGALQLPLFEF
ncbi:MAG: putative DNA modification/repair radical SAM protein [Spirochaetaceae bacterium]|jgi:putative DNA modification/repair radical SAM protein|nr:putative DNA modification/repair radical SAM protein [Spirochaetaceae bacterium]